MDSVDPAPAAYPLVSSARPDARAAAVVARWPALDGLRGVAVALVVVFHAALGPGVNGYIGVDVFFALSGFLITALLLREHDRAGRVNLGHFYLRRVLRLYPALVLVCLGAMAIAVVAHKLGEVGPAALAALAYVTNWWVYTGHPATLLEHTWTLAIEEHYYLLWPAILVAGLSRRRLLRVAAGLAILLVVVLLTVRWPGDLDAVRGSYLRGAPIAWGSLLALVWGRLRPRGEPAPGARPSRLLGVVGWALLLGLLWVGLTPASLSGTWLQGPRSLPGLISTLLVAVVVLGGTAPGVLGWRPLVWLGQRSYGVYLYHFPVLSLLRHQVHVPADERVRVLVGVVLTLVVAAVSYRIVEAPLLALKSRIARPSAPDHG